MPDSPSKTRTHREVHTDEATGIARRAPLAWWWVALLAIPLVLAALGSWLTHKAIEDDLTTRTTAALKEAGYTPQSVTFSGRDGTISVTGSGSPSAEEIALAVEGVRVILPSDGAKGATSNVESSTPPAADGGADAASGVTLSQSAEGIKVTATVPSEDDKQALLDAVTKSAGSKKVIDNVTVTEGAAALIESGAAQAAELATLLGADGVSAEVTDTGIVLDGEVPTDDVKKSLNAKAEELSPGKVTDNLTVAGGGAGTGEGDNAAGDDAAGEGTGDDAAGDDAAGESSTDAAASCATVNKSIKEKLTANPIRFSKSGATLDASSATVLKDVAAMLKPCIGDASNSSIEVQGHTSNTGGRDMNVRLSSQRAQAVKAALTNGGVPASAIEAKGYGPDKPVADNNTNDGRAKNRRVEIILSLS